jgi:hypothetical protein
MGELIRSLFKFSLDASSFALNQMASLISPSQPNEDGQESSGGRNTSGASVPTSIRTAEKLDAGTASSRQTRFPAPSGRLNTRKFIVLGEGLAAGIGDFYLNEAGQTKSFPAQMAEQIGVDFHQALIQAPGIGNLEGFGHVPVSVPAEMQTTFLSNLLDPNPRNNLSISGLLLTDCVELRTCAPLVVQHDAKQTIANFVLGMTGLIESGNQGVTQLEYALNSSPTFVILALGYYEVLRTAVHGTPTLLPQQQNFMATFARIIRALKETGAEVTVMNIPDPLDTAYFSSVEAASEVLRAEPALLLKLYGLENQDRLTVPGLVEIGNQLLGKSIHALSSEHFLSSAVAAQISSWTNSIDQQLAVLAREHGAVLYDLRTFFRNVKNLGCSLCPGNISGGFLGGFYSLNGYYPGPTGNAVLANDILAFLNQAYDADFPMIDACRIMRTDPVAMYRPAKGPLWTLEHVVALQQPPKPMMGADGPSQPGETGGQSLPSSGTGLSLPDALEQVLPLDFVSSYFGEAIRAVNCENDQDAKYGSCALTLFGGLILVDSHLRGNLRIKFTPPVNDVTHFQVFLEGGLTGSDSTLVAPNFYRMPFQQNGVRDVPGQPCSGTLNLVTGEVNAEDLKFSFGFTTTGLSALALVNPHFPRTPISFPGQYGSAWAHFEQRSDGKLDFTFYGTTFLPLGKALGGDLLRLPLPFAGPTLGFASVPASGTAMHPHIRLSTRNVVAAVACEPASIPCNSIQEYTLFTHNSSFGDHFSLNIPEFGGDGTGRSQLMGRLRLQFGERSGNSVPVAVSLMTPGGSLRALQSSPVSQAFPGRFSPGPHGFDEFLRFPFRTYFLETVSFLDDPFDLSVGAIDVNTGQFIGGLLHRGFLAQDVFFALVRIEPRTPRSSFLFKGPAAIEKGKKGQTIFRMQADTRLPYPEGFLFPQPDLATAFVVGPNSFLEPYLWIRGISEPFTEARTLRGGASQVRASNGDSFSYSYSLSDGTGGNPLFDYVNHTQEGKFSLGAVTWIKFMNSRESDSSPEDYDTITFAGFGTWTKDGVEKACQVTAQICNSVSARYVGIQVDGGEVSDVNTKPPQLQDVVP